jgi:hypothetical protein
MRKTRRAAILAATIAVASVIAVPAAGASTERVRDQDEHATTTTTTSLHDGGDPARRCDRDRAADRPIDCRVDARRPQCDRDRAPDRPIDCRNDRLRPVLARCVHWALEHTSIEPGGGYRFWERVCRRIAWNAKHPL